MNNTNEKWPESGLEQVDLCPICGCTVCRQIYSGLTDSVFRCSPGEWSIYQCADCRSAYLNPRPTIATIHLAYQHYYTHQRSQRQISAELSSLRFFIRKLANGYRNWRYNSRIFPASRFGPITFAILPGLKEVLDREMRYLPKLKKNGRLLDVGFGDGAFLELAQSVGWLVNGVDLDSVSVKNARHRGLDVRHGGIEAFEDMPNYFDVVTMNHVIEHVHDPIDVLRRAYDLLKPGGQLFIETPNIEAYGHDKFKRHWRGLEIPRHLIIFSWDAIDQLLMKVGFRKLNCIYSFKPYAHLANASRQMEKGFDPYTQPNKKLTDKFIALLLKLNPFANKKKSEFILIKAYKPK